MPWSWRSRLHEDHLVDVSVANIPFPHFVQNNGEARRRGGAIAAQLYRDEDFRGYGHPFADVTAGRRTSYHRSALRIFLLFRHDGGGFLYLSLDSGLRAKSRPFRRLGVRILDYDTTSPPDLSSSTPRDDKHQPTCRTSPTVRGASAEVRGLNFPGRVARRREISTADGRRGAASCTRTRRRHGFIVADFDGPRPPIAQPGRQQNPGSIKASAGRRATGRLRGGYLYAKTPDEPPLRRDRRRYLSAQTQKSSSVGEENALKKSRPRPTAGSGDPSRS